MIAYQTMGMCTAMPLYDAVVVGAGPAGASAAGVLARGGARVLLIERARLPRYKPCGGGITARARAASGDAAAFAPETLAGSVRLADGERALECPLPAPIGMTMRARFDAHLTECAVRAGAELRDGTALAGLEHERGAVRLLAGSETIAARYVVGADGANGVTARLAGLIAARESATAIEVETAVHDAVLDRYARQALLDFTTVRGGYAWIFGKEDHLSAGVYTIDPAARRDLRPALQAFLAGNPDLRGGRLLLRRGHRVPLAGGRTRRRRGRVLLAGDAAALADPLTGEGISYALASGRRAGGFVLAALAAGPAALAGYDRYLARTICGDLRFARLIATLAYRAPAFGLRLTAEHPGMQALTAATISGTIRYRALAAHLLRGTPKLLRYLGR